MADQLEQFHDNPKSNEQETTSEITAATIEAFDRYHELCYSPAESHRQLGILFPEQYELVMQDPETVFSERPPSEVSAQPERLPVLISINNAFGYDPEYTRDLTQSKEYDKVFLLAITPDRMEAADIKAIKNAVDQAEADGKAVSIVCETPAERTEVAMDFLSHFLAMHPIEFTNPNARPEHQTAAMVLHTLRVGLPPEAAVPAVRPPIPLPEVARKLSQESLPQAPYMINGADILRDEALLNQLWDIFSERFGGDLSEGHPVSMEENFDDFKRFLDVEGVFAIIKNGEISAQDPAQPRFETPEPAYAPECVALLASSLEPCIWLDPAFVNAQNREAAARGDSILYFSSIATTATAKSGRDAIEIMHFLSQTLAASQQQSGKATTLVFETTNLSEGYIPVLLTRAINRTGGVRTLTPDQKRQLNYTALKRDRPVVKAA